MAVRLHSPVLSKMGFDFFVPVVPEPHCELDESSPYPETTFLRSILILSFRLRLGLPRSLLLRFSTKVLYSSPRTFYMLRLSNLPD